MRRYTFFLLLVITILSSLTKAQSVNSSRQENAAESANNDRKKPTVKVLQGEGSPLRIASVKTKWATPDQQMLEIYVVVKNQGELGIRAYALRNTGGNMPVEANTCFLHNVQSVGKIIQQGGEDGKSLWRAVPADENSSVIEVEVDFVEFENGNAWGADTCQSGERLGGIRAGAKAAKEHLSKMIELKGAKDLPSIANESDTVVDTPQGHSPAWVEGFQGGVRAFLGRVRKANEDGGLPEAQRILKGPVDASENN